MLIGCALVAVLYLLVNWVFVANLTPNESRAVFEYETKRVTLGHLVIKDLLGEAGGIAMSFLSMTAFVAATSAMMLVGPRVYAAMAEDGFLPQLLAAKQGQAPTGSVLLQAALALVLLFTHTLQEVLTNVGAILTLFAALVSLTIFRVHFGQSRLPKPGPLTLVAAGIHVASAAYMLYFGFRGKTHLWLWIGGILAVTAVALLVYRVTLWLRLKSVPDEG